MRRSPRSEPPADGWRYLIALGGNVHARQGTPAAVLRAVPGALADAGLEVVAASSIHFSAPLGPSGRTYANGAAVVATRLDPLALLALLQAIERDFGRRRGRRWGARVLDLDIVLWSGGGWRTRRLAIPHPAFRMRDFVLRPAVAIARGWRDPGTGRTLGHTRARLTRARALPNRTRKGP